MLRSQGKSAGSKATTNFGACRDLNGRRLRHVNQEIAIQKWQEDQARRAEQKKSGGVVGPSSDETTVSGIEGWYLNAPSWAEGLKRATRKSRKKTQMCTLWLDARKDGCHVPAKAPVWWGCPRGRNCDFAHGESEIQNQDYLLTFQTREKRAQKQAQIEARNQYTAIDTDVIRSEVASAVQMGLLNQQKKNKTVSQDALLSVSRTPRASSWISPLFGAVEIDDRTSDIRGVSDFGTASVSGCYLSEGKWYYEVEIITTGIIQIGWADESFEGNSNTGDGVGDHHRSWAYDGHRQQKWNGQPEPEKYGKGHEMWNTGDVVGCSLDCEAQTMTFYLNGQSLGPAFEHIRPAAVGKRQCGFYPAISLEEGERVQMNIGEREFQFFDSCDLNGFQSVGEALPAFACSFANTKSTKSKKPAQVEAVQEPIVEQKPLVDRSRATPNSKKRKTEESIVADTLAKAQEKVTPVTCEAIDLTTIQSVEELQMLGLDRLKSGLRAERLKCGGSLEERARRLFLIKGKERHEIDPNAFAKKAKL